MINQAASTIKKENTVVVVGGGMVGLALAKALGDASIKTLVVESKAPLLEWQPTDVTARVSAINAATQQFLQHIGVQSLLHPQSISDLQCLRVWDAVGGGEIVFDSAEVGEAALGAIVENREIIRVLWKALEQHEHVELLCPATPEQLIHQDEGVRLVLSDGRDIDASLIVGADGARSWVRGQMNSVLTQRPYQHSAVVAVVKTELPHQQTGWQAFLGGGVVALLPLSDMHHCAIVWSVLPDEAEALVAKDPIAFNDELNNAFGSRLGRIEVCNIPQAIPLMMRHVRHYVEPRCALVGDAAHTIHPLAGQGVNLGFMDAACLSHSLIDAVEQGRDLGSMRVLRRYERARKGDNALMLAAMRGFKELFASQSPLVIQARNMGLQCVDRLSFVKNHFMSVALGPRDVYLK